MDGLGFRHPSSNLLTGIARRNSRNVSVLYLKVVSRREEEEEEEDRKEEEGTGRIDDRIWNGGHFPAVIREPR